MTGHRPQPMTPGDEYLALLLTQVEKQGEVLAEIRDRLPEPAAKSGSGEPARSGQPQTVELREPEPARRAPAKKTNQRASRQR